MEKTHLVYWRVIGLKTKTMNPKVFNRTPVILRTVLLSDMWLLSASLQKKNDLKNPKASYNLKESRILKR